MRSRARVDSPGAGRCAKGMARGLFDEGNHAAEHRIRAVTVRASAAFAARVIRRRLHSIPEMRARDPTMALQRVLREGLRQGHAAAFGKATRFARASSESFSMRQCGIEFEVFQLDTVEGGTPNAWATATVPPRSTMNCEMLCMRRLLRKP